MCIRDRNSSNFEYTTARFRGKVAVPVVTPEVPVDEPSMTCLLYTSDAADERSSVDLGGRRIIKKKNENEHLTLAI